MISCFFSLSLSRSLARPYCRLLVTCSDWIQTFLHASTCNAVETHTHIQPNKHIMHLRAAFTVDRVSVNSVMLLKRLSKTVSGWNENRKRQAGREGNLGWKDEAKESNWECSNTCYQLNKIGFLSIVCGFVVTFFLHSLTLFLESALFAWPICHCPPSLFNSHCRRSSYFHLFNTVLILLFSRRPQ